jgi:glycosyltransferase involved in cell wall biosynthesis
MPQMHIGGAEKVLTYLLSELKKQDLKLTVISRKPITSEFFANYFKDNPDISVKIIPSSSWRRPNNKTVRLIWRLHKQLFGTYARNRYHKIFRDADIVFDYLNFSTYRVKLTPKIPYIAVYHSSFPQFVIDNEISKIGRYTKLIGLSESFANDFCEKYPGNANKIAWIYNPIHQDNIIMAANGCAGGNGKYFVCCNRMHWHKDMEAVIRAFDKFYTEKNPDCKLYMVGDGPKRPEWQELSESLKSAKNIVWIGEVPNPFGYMRDAMALIMSSHNEGLPTVLCEAMALGTLCIASNCKSGTGEIMCSGGGGLLFEPGNIDELAKCMSDVYNECVDSQEIKRVAMDGLKRFSPDKIASEIKKLIERL